MPNNLQGYRSCTKGPVAVVFIWPWIRSHSPEGAGLTNAPPCMAAFWGLRWEIDACSLCPLSVLTKSSIMFWSALFDLAIQWCFACSRYLPLGCVTKVWNAAKGQDVVFEETSQLVKQFKIINLGFYYLSFYLSTKILIFYSIPWNIVIKNHIKNKSLYRFLFIQNGKYMLRFICHSIHFIWHFGLA